MSPNSNFYKKFHVELVLLTIIFLFFFQLISDFIESIYATQLLQESMDEKALAILFLISPFILIAFKDKIPNHFLEMIAILIVITRVINPLLNTIFKIVCAGVGVSCFFLFFPAYFTQNYKENREQMSIRLATALALAVLISITFRALYSSIDISTYGNFQFIGWILAGMVIFSIIARLKISYIEDFGDTIKERKEFPEEKIKSERAKSSRMIYALALGFISTLTINYFAFSSPTVISRWTGGNYITIMIILALMISASILILSVKPEILNKFKSYILWLWNIIFAVSVVLTIAVHTFPFPANPDSNAVIIKHPAPWFYFIPLIVMLLSVPIIFIDFFLLITRTFQATGKTLQIR